MKRGLFLLTVLGLLLTGTSLTYAQDGASEAEVTIVKYSDYQCPACMRYYLVEKEVKEEYGDRVEFVTKHFPLNIHQHAQIASRAAEAARKQGKYEEMHNMLFMGQGQWSRASNAEAIFLGYASSMDLDVEQFQQDMNSADMQRIVMADRREGLNLNVNSTPTFFIDGDKLENLPPSVEAFKQVIEAHISKEDS